MIVSLNYPTPTMSTKEVVIYRSPYITAPKGIVHMNPLIASEFSETQLLDIIDEYCTGTFEGYWVDEDLYWRNVSLKVIIVDGWGREAWNWFLLRVGGIGGQRHAWREFLKTNYDAWRRGDLYVMVDGIDDDGDYPLSEFYLPIWLTDAVYYPPILPILKSRIEFYKTILGREIMGIFELFGSYSHYQVPVYLHGRDRFPEDSKYFKWDRTRYGMSTPTSRIRNRPDDGNYNFNG